MQRCTIVVNVRDRFSCRPECLDRLIAETPEPYDPIVVVGGASDRARHDWLRRFGDRARFIFEPHFLNQAQARNIGLRAATSRFAVMMDNDVFVRPGWLKGLLDCQRETGAVMVVPSSSRRSLASIPPVTRCTSPTRTGADFLGTRSCGSTSTTESWA
jgi:GT2 family glycosyltransferase